jgi:antirestriction protein
VNTPEHAAPSPEHQSVPRPRIYVASLADYNAGVLHGAWIDSTAELDEINEGVERMLAASPTTPQAEEYAIHDFEAFGAYRPDEHDSLGWLHAVATGIAEHGPPFGAWAEQCDHDPERLAQFADAYLGEYESVADYAEQLLDDLGLGLIIEEHIPVSLQRYVTITAEAFGNDLALGDIAVVEHSAGVWIFDPRI